MDFKQKAKTIFAAYSKEDTIYFTADGQAFFQSHFAEAHAGNQKNKTVVSVTRKDLEAAEIDPDAQAKIDADNADKQAAIDAAAKELEDQQKALADAQAKIDADNADKQAAIDAAAKELEDQQKALADKQAKIEEDAKALADAQAKFDAVKAGADQNAVDAASKATKK